MKSKILSAVTLISCSTLLIIAGCKVSAPGSAETKLVQSMKHNVTIGGKDDKNPTPDTPATVKEGQEHFGHHCQICHGMDGAATGVPFANKMSPPVPDLKSKDVQDYTDGQLKWIIDNGIEPSGMPGWKGILSDEEAWNIVRFIRHLPRERQPRLARHLQRRIRRAREDGRHGTRRKEQTSQSRTAHKH